MDIDTILLAEISQNIKALQLQLDYERAKIITALGGEPVMMAGTGVLKPGFVPVAYGGGATTTQVTDSPVKVYAGGGVGVGNGSAIAGATMQVDGAFVIGDGAGGKKAGFTSLGQVEVSGAVGLIPTGAAYCAGVSGTPKVIATITSAGYDTISALVVINCYTASTYFNSVWALSGAVNQVQVAKLAESYNSGGNPVTLTATRNDTTGVVSLTYTYTQNAAQAASITVRALPLMPASGISLYINS